MQVSDVAHTVLVSEITSTRAPRIQLESWTMIRYLPNTYISRKKVGQKQWRNEFKSPLSQNKGSDMVSRLWIELGHVGRNIQVLIQGGDTKDTDPRLDWSKLLIGEARHRGCIRGQRRQRLGKGRQSRRLVPQAIQ